MKFKRIFLIGFRTTGKSTAGKILAEQLNWSFLDMDFLITEEAGETIDKLTKNGTNWKKFRRIENEVLKEISELTNVVVSCGGGVGANEISGELNRDILLGSKDSLIVQLTLPEDVIKERLERQYRNKKIMPFIDAKKAREYKDLSGEDLIKAQIEDSIHEFKKRKKIYESIADFEIDTSSFTFPQRIANLNIVIGDPLDHTLSPIMHNSAYKKLNIDSSNLFIPVRVGKKNLGKIIDVIKVLGINGISVTVPHKEEVIKYLDSIDEIARKIGAVNTIVNDDGKLTGYNTDWIGATTALGKKTNLKGKKTAVLGAGGAARAIVYGLVKKGANVKIFNRSVEKGEELAKEFGCEFGEVGDIGEIQDFDIIVNATSVGMNEDRSPIDKKLLNKNHIVLDAVYSPKETTLLKDAKEKGAKIVYGYEMLLYQGVEQFKMYTGLEASVEEMRKVLEK